MTEKKTSLLPIPPRPRSIAKGSSLADLLDDRAVAVLAHNLRCAEPGFPAEAFSKEARSSIKDLGIKERGLAIARALSHHLPKNFGKAVAILTKSLGPALTETEDLGLAPFFYLPHVTFVHEFGCDKSFNQGKDPFEAAMAAQHALTMRFSAEFSIRPFLIHHTARTLKTLQKWTRDPNPHVRRLCSEGSRPRLPWAECLPVFIKDPSPLAPILSALKDDPELYVRRSVANSLGDILKDNPTWALELLASWLPGADENRKWLIRHALRHPAKKGVKRALEIRKLAA